MRPDPRLLELLWSVHQVGRLDLPAPDLGPAYWRAVPRVRLDRRRVRELLPLGDFPSGAVVAFERNEVLLCLN